jgi:hypothetical protein
VVKLLRNLLPFSLNPLWPKHGHLTFELMKLIPQIVLNNSTSLSQYNESPDRT